jgi:hypothetical protein
MGLKSPRQEFCASREEVERLWQEEGGRAGFSSSWLRVFVFIPAFVAVTLAGCDNLPIPSDPALRSTGPYLQMDAPDSVIVSWFTPDPLIGTVELLDAAGDHVIATFSESQPIKHHVVRVIPPAVGAAYKYRLTGPAATDSDVHELARIARAGDALRFAVVGDSGSGLPAQRAVAAAIAADRPDHVLHTGDIVYPDGSDGHYDRTFFRPFAALMDRAPLLPCIGNHDVETLDGQAYLDNFILPRNGPAGLEERCYSLLLGDVQLVAVDSTRDPAIVDNTILPWVRGVLGGSTATWRFLLLHHPVYFSGSNRHTFVPEETAKWAQLCDELHVDLCLTGHDHLYERSVPLRAGVEAPPGQGTVYIVSGNGGQFLYDLIEPAPFSAAHNDTLHGFVRIDVAARRLSLAEVTTRGNVIDEVSWEK